jgi:hypothetical protein
VVKLPEYSGFPAFVAQRIEHLTTDQKVGGSSPSKRTKILGSLGFGGILSLILNPKAVTCHPNRQSI